MQTIVKSCSVPAVISGNVVTAGRSNFNGFVVTMAHLLGFNCQDRFFGGHMDAWTPEDYEK